MTNPNNRFDGLYYDFSTPLSLHRLINRSIEKNQSNPNTPQVPVQRAPREWFSQPAPYGQGTAPQVTVILVDGTHDLLDIDGKPTVPLPDNPLLARISGLVDPTTCVVQVLNWPQLNDLPMYNSVYAGKVELMAMIEDLNGAPFILVGYSQGAIVTSLVLEEIQSGVMTAYASQLLAGITFGNPMRQAGKVAPVQTDPGGAGIWSTRLTSTPTWWWDFALPEDIITALGDGDYTQLISDADMRSVFDFAMRHYTGGDMGQFLLTNARNLPSDIFNDDDDIPWILFFLFLIFFILIFLFDWFSTPTSVRPNTLTEIDQMAAQPHRLYYNTAPPGATLDCSHLAANYINTTAKAWQKAYIFTPPTEVLTVNLKLPLSVGHLSFQVLRMPCNVTAWYQDRNGNWVQMTDASNNPISLNVSYSSKTSWYTYCTAVYPIVGTAVQLRMRRTFDPQVGNNPYVVGIKELLIQRNVFSLNDTTQAIADQQDVLGNTITSYVKCWSPANVLDNNPNTFWKSFPCPDPNGVVSLFLDVRDANGDPQLIDTIYIDPVYTGNTLNLYYSNDSAQGTLILNSTNLPPDTQVNSTWTLGSGMADSSGPDLAESKLLFPTAFGPMIEQPMWIGIEWLPNFVPSSGPSDNPLLFTVQPTVNTVQLVTLNGHPTGGSFTLGGSTNIAYNATAATVKSALEALDDIGTGNVDVEGSAGGPWEVTFIGTLAGTNVAQLNATSALTGGTVPSVEVDVTATGFTPAYLNENTYYPTIYYDVGAGEIVVEFSNGTTTHSYSQALNPSFTGLLPLEIVVGWQYSPNQVYISVTEGRSKSLGSTTTNPATNLPSNITLDGTAGYVNFCGLMSATVVKQDLWTNGSAAFQANPTIYTNPAPVLPDANGNYPSTSLDNAILAVDWTSQQMPIGGTDESWFANKIWTPIFSNYVTSKGNLFLPQKYSMSYLKLEFSNLTPEPYPIYDQGIQVTYDTYPVSVLQASTTKSQHALQAASRLISLGADMVAKSIGSVNWMNPQTVQNAVNANWGKTQQPLIVQTGPGTLTGSIPNTTQSNISASTRTEASSPWIYNRRLPSASSLAGQYLQELANGAAIQGQQSTAITTLVIGSGSNSPTNSTVGNPSSVASQTVAANFTPVVTRSTSNVLPQQGQDWWIFPGANLKLPATIMKALTSTRTVTKKPAVTNRLRFTTTSVHRYNTATLTMDAAVAYFAGVSEVQPYVTSYIATNDPPSFTYTQYDPVTFSYSNILQEPTGPLTTTGSPYVLENPNFEYPLELTPWTATGPWTWSASGGLGFLSGQACAQFAANGTNGKLVSEPIAVSPGDQIIFGAYVSFEDAVSASGGELSISAVAYNSGTPTPITLSMPATSATFTGASESAMLAQAGVIVGDSYTITGASGGFQGTWTLFQTPSSNIANWALTGYGTYVNQPSGNIDGDIAVPLVGTYTVPGSGVDHVAVQLNVTSAVTAGTINFNNVTMQPLGGIEGTVNFHGQTSSTFADMTVNVSDSGLLNSDSMWARLDPLDTNINNLALAPYVTTIPSTVPSGFWDDTQATWDDLNIDWGEPFSEVAITLDPNLIFQGNRAMHFTRAAGAGEAGIVMTQQTNMMAQELVQLGCSFYKPVANGNQIIVRLRRVSDGVYVHEETFTPVVGAWYTYLGQFFELPNTYDQVYEIEFVLTGDDADECYLANLFCNIAGIRYLVQLGDSGAFDFDVTPLVYADNANVSVTTPVNEFSLTVGIFNPDCWAYGISLVPRYLK